MFPAEHKMLGMVTLYYAKLTMRLLTKLVLASHTQNTHAQMHRLEVSRDIFFRDSVRIY